MQNFSMVLRTASASTSKTHTPGEVYSEQEKIVAPRFVSEIKYSEAVLDVARALLGARSTAFHFHFNSLARAFYLMKAGYLLK